jgi:hypothetical protein
MTPSDYSPSSPSSATPPSDFVELIKTVRSLRILLNLTLSVLLLLIVLLNAFMLYQIRTMRRQAAELLPSVDEMRRLVSDYETNGVPVMQRFTQDLRRFADRNPDFTPILSRYAGAIPAGKPTNAPPQKASSGPAPKGN